MYEIFILAGIGGLVFVFVKNKFTKYEDEINELKKKLSQEFTAEQKSNMKKFGDDFERKTEKIIKEEVVEKSTSASNEKKTRPKIFICKC